MDQYKHRQLGFIECPAVPDIVFGNSTREIGIYELLQNIPEDERDFDGKEGDILVGGGSGEAPALRISIPDALKYFTSDDWDEFNDHDELYKAFWTPTESYIFGEGFSRLGWTVDTMLDYWLAEEVCKLLINVIESYSRHNDIGLDNKSVLTFKKLASAER